ncbi:hypoxanthine phosphoribosyltransferase [Deinococcus radiopugnans]|uniref:Hypoxanthine phosphoribosyltransferase n=2 Tax=Deinococcus radiopugnans TaxID=57497 RepID=A0A0A7KDK8_9DEIO|nr:hypoxanthine phosphoribosyltransferase [Deinococcus radiopugnans]AIZ44252.1 hypoxanthine phosphoribosyltransferase [Deinococcus radiopugnans]MBB6015650.1 hypoxanthine phosphoribosyltransferase [Deinococcus radiopugnans ATCC 19172]QLG09819.1 hypoxanthine phosphoribosyltransferase [Deinococcus sp. D7000]TNM72653.1 hypoxanthine phosphoribosyltransferase [Deinococcus radiopugnans ATCC 19172]
MSLASGSPSTASLVPGPGPVQITSEQIQARVGELAARIRQEYAGREPHLICVLNGAFMFHADLVRALDMPCTMDFLQASSYGSAKQSSGEVRLVKDLQFPISDRHVILVEDIVDTGITMNYLLHYLEGRGPATIKIAALLSKPSRRKVEVPVEYLGFTIPDAFVYGYGLDRSQYDRNLPFITSQE